MQIIKNRAIINDPWRLEDGGGQEDGQEDDKAGDQDGRHDYVILPVERWLVLRSSIDLAGRNIGIRLKPDDEVESIAADLDGISLVALEFGSFNEGRGYSQAAQLRRQYHFTGEIRALGAHRDNLPLMERCGIDAYQLADGENLQQAMLAFEELTAYY